MKTRLISVLSKNYKFKLQFLLVRLPNEKHTKKNKSKTRKIDEVG